MIRNTLWSLATVAAVTLVLAYPTSANQGVPLGRTGGKATAPAAKTKSPSPSARPNALPTPSLSR
jgi:hypothetical protein